MNNIINSLILTSLSGLVTLIGYLAIFIKGDKNCIISFALSFATGVMLFVSTTDLIPSSYHYLNNYYCFYRILIIIFFIILGYFLSSFFEKHIPTNTNNSLYKVGLFTMFGIIIHNIPEGIITFLISQVNQKLGFKMALAIGLHNLPEGISIAIPIYYSTKNRLKTFAFIFVASLSELLGGLLSIMLFKNVPNNQFIGIMLSIVAGIMINIAICNLWPESLNYNKKNTYIGLLFGIIVMLVSHYI